jgi:hypothetical protein
MVLEGLVIVPGFLHLCGIAPKPLTESAPVTIAVE